MSRWVITDATLDDAGPLAVILGDWIRETAWMPVLYDRAGERAFVAGLIGTHVVRVARADGEALGFLARLGGQVDALYLAPAGRGLGVGRAFLDEVKALEAVVELWTFEANARAVAFYRREGFEVVERTDGRGNDEGLPDLRLVWRRAL